MACPETLQDTHSAKVGDDVAHIYHDTFLAASEGGFIFSRAEEGRSEAPWNSAIPGSLATLSWTMS